MAECIGEQLDKHKTGSKAQVVLEIRMSNAVEISMLKRKIMFQIWNFQKCFMEIRMYRYIYRFKKFWTSNPFLSKICVTWKTWSLRGEKYWIDLFIPKSFNVWKIIPLSYFICTVYHPSSTIKKDGQNLA